MPMLPRLKAHNIAESVASGGNAASSASRVVRVTASLPFPGKLRLGRTTLGNFFGVGPIQTARDAPHMTEIERAMVTTAIVAQSSADRLHPFHGLRLVKTIETLKSTP